MTEQDELEVQSWRGIPLHEVPVTENDVCERFGVARVWVHNAPRSQAWPAGIRYCTPTEADDRNQGPWLAQWREVRGWGETAAAAKAACDAACVRKAMLLAHGLDLVAAARGGA